MPRPERPLDVTLICYLAMFGVAGIGVGCAERSPLLSEDSAFNSRTFAYLVGVAHFSRLSEPDEFWPALHDHAMLVASLPSGSGDTASVLVDYFATEAAIRIPPGSSTDFGTSIAPPEGVHVLTCMSRHDAKVLHTRMAKRGLFNLRQSTGIFSAYDRKFEQLPELCSATLSFFGRLADHISSDNDRLIVATIETSESEWNP